MRGPAIFLHAFEIQTKYVGSSISEHSCAGRHKAMDPDIWKKLPTDLMMEVFCRVPFIPKLMELRLLNKYWKAEIDFCLAIVTLLLLSREPHIFEGILL